MDILLYIGAGALVGLAVGLTGVGGGSLMTPLLLLFGFPAHIAVGTDLLYAAITKSGGAYLHLRQNTIRKDIVALLLMTSLPASAITALLLYLYFPHGGHGYSHILTSSLGVMLIITASVLLFKKKLVDKANHHDASGLLASIQANPKPYTLLMGAILGTLVTLSSVGAGAFGAAVLLVLYPSLAALKIIGTDLAHAVPLTLFAGLFHLMLGNVDFYLLGSLLIGSLPAIWIGTRIGARLPDTILHPILVSTLMLLGIKYSFF